MERITKAKAGFVLFTESSNGRIFHVKFRKKDGTIRSMRARRRVKKGVTGKGMKYDPLKEALLTVFDMDKGAFRLVNLTDIISISANGNKYLVV